MKTGDACSSAITSTWRQECRHRSSEQGMRLGVQSAAGRAELLEPKARLPQSLTGYFRSNVWQTAMKCPVCPPVRLLL